MRNRKLSEKIVAVVLAVLLMASVLVVALTPVASVEVWNGDIASDFAGGGGTKDNPYIISNGAELALAVNSSKEDTYYKLVNDIYLNHPDRIDWKTGEYSGDAPNPWYKNIAVQGNFDGAGHTVYGLYYNGNNGSLEGTKWGINESIGLFPEIAAGTKLTITGLGVDKSYLSGKQGVGALVGAKSEDTATLATLEISKCYVGKDVTLIGFDAAAFLAITRGINATATDSYSLATLKANTSSNGRTGLITDKWTGSITVTRCYNGNGPIDSKNEATCKNTYATEAGGVGAIILSKDKMQGMAAADSMIELGSEYVTTAGYPALLLFMDNLDESINKVIKPVALSSEEHRALARKAVGEGLVLLKNKDYTLPLDKDNTVAFFGKGQNSSYFGFGGGGSGSVYLNYTAPGPAEVFAEMAEQGKIGIYKPLYNAYMNNSSYTPDEAMYQAAAEEADTSIIVITRKNGEGNDSTAGEWWLTDAEKALLTNSTKYFENVIVIINSGSSFCTDWSLEGNSLGVDVDALLICHAPGEMGGYGIYDVLTGAVNPSGKLTDTYAAHINDYPSTESFYESDDYVNYTDDIYVGYRYFETFAPEKVVYEFGFGLSYTTFDIKTDSVTNDGKNITVKATVKNTGSVAGKEVVQVYFSAPQKGEGSAVLSKSAIELAGFAKTKLLAPGESEQVTITYKISDMSSYDDVGYTPYKSAYVLEAGTYDIFVGNSVKKNTKQGEYVVDAITVTEQLKKYGDVTLEERLEADGKYTDPSIPLLKDGQIFVKDDAVTVIEGEAIINKDGTIKNTENFANNGYISDGFSWYTIPAGVVLGNFQDNGGKYFYYDLVVEKAGTYKLGFVTSNGNEKGKNEGKAAEDLLSLEYSTNGSSWNAVNGFAFDSVNTRYNSVNTSKQWFNFVYTDTDLQGKAYSVTLPKGEVKLRFKINGASTSYANTNIDKFMVIPKDISFGLSEVITSYGLEPKPVIKADSTIWVEAETYSSSSNAKLKIESYSGNANFNTGTKTANITGTSCGNFHGYSGKYVYYNFIVETAGTYNLGFIHSDGNKSSYDSGKFGDNIFAIEYSSDGGATYTAAGCPAFDSTNTYGAISSKDQWFNFVYTTADTDGKLYQLTLPKGAVTIRFKIAGDINGESMGSVTNCNLDKFSISPASDPCTLADACEMYGLESDTVVGLGGTVWFEAEAYDSNSTAKLKIENYSGNANFNTGTKNATITGTSCGSFHDHKGKYVYYSFYVETAGTYNLGFIHSDGNKSSYNAGKFGDNIFAIEYSSDGGATYTAAGCPDFDSTNTYGAISANEQWFNFVYTTADTDGKLYQLTLPKGAITLRFKIANDINGEAMNSVTNCNLDKFSISHSSNPTTLGDACKMYGLDYIKGINSNEAIWFEGESYAVKGDRVGTENFVNNAGSLHEGTIYAALPAGAVVGYFDKTANGYAEYNLTSEKAGVYNIGFTVGTGNDKAKNNGGKAPDVIDVMISTDGGATWVKQFALDVKYTGKSVTGTSENWWNFYYSNADFDGNQYQINIPAGNFKMRFACNENSVTYGGANIDKFVIYPTSMNYTEANAVAYYFNKDDNTEGDTPDTPELPDPLDIDFDKDNYKGITFEDILAGTATWEQLIAQMSYSELIDLATGKYDQWNYGFTGYIGFSSDVTANKYGIYAGDTADGPQGLRMEYKNTTFWPNAVLQASTWNTDLLYEIGEAVAEECLKNSIDMWLAPGMNIHRSPLGGRNFEYYSEDPFISGVMAAAVVNGLESKGVAATIKHFAVNNKETNRKFSDSRVSEKALREIYLEGFRLCIELSNPICVMSSYNLVNGEWTSTSEALLRGIMRDEWGYEGLIMSDWSTTPMPSDELIGGNNCHMIYSEGDTPDLKNAVIYGFITREMLEENAYYIITNLAKMPDMAINLDRETEVDTKGVITIPSTFYTKKSQRARQVINSNIFDMPGTKGYFYEYNVDVKTAGKYAIGVEYSATATTNGAFKLYVNGEEVTADNNLASTSSSVATAVCTAATVDLDAGVSTIRIEHIGANGKVNYRAIKLDAVVEGDVDDNGFVDVCDLVYLENIILGKFEATDDSDLNSDGKFDNLDTAELRKLLIA